MEHVLVDRGSVRLRRPARLLRLASDERLVALVRAGEEGAFEALYDRHHPAILGFCRHMLGTREEAEDAVQHTFLAAFRDLAGSDKPIELRPWLFAIARNRCLSLLRARRAHVAIELAEPTTDGLAATVERREDVRELLSDLAGLPEDQRAALLLAELGALDHAGIATVLGCPREKVKALVFQARTSLAASREARATPCEEIRLELATASGAALRRGPLRRHLRACDSCRAFKAEVATQRKLLAVALPVVPTIALKASVLSGGAGATSSGGAAAATATTAGTASSASGAFGGVLGTVASTGAGKLAMSLAVAGMVAGGTLSERLAQQGSTTPRLYEPAGSTHASPSARRDPLSARGPAPQSAAAPAQRLDRRPLPADRADMRSAASGTATAPTATAPHAGLRPRLEQTPAQAEPSPRKPDHGATPPVAVPPGPERAPTAPPGQAKAPSAPPSQGKAPTTPPSQPRAPSTPPGQEKAPTAPPSQSRVPSTPPGQSGAAPGQANAPAQSGAGQSGAAAPGPSGGAPGQSGNAPGQSGTSHGHGR
jgi:RNA polymerase sigma factor (sigma-70 family)